MSRRKMLQLSSICLVLIAMTGCASPYRADQGALFGGLLGAGVGALAGEAAGNPLAGAAIGAGAGALTGAVVGGSLDEIEASNRAEIEARLGRPISGNPVTIADVVAMSQAGISDSVIVNHINIHGTIGPLQTGDLIYLQQQGVSPVVVQAMQSPRYPVPPQSAYPAPPQVIVEEHYIGPGYGPGWPHRYPYYHRGPRWHGHGHGHPRAQWGISFSN